MIKNEPVKYPNDYAVNSVRSAYENAARWYCYLAEEGLENGLPAEFICDAMRESGAFQAKEQYQGINGISEFVSVYMDFEAEKAFEGEVVSCGEDKAEIRFGYCPLVAAWQKLGRDEAFIRELCRCCREMDKAAAETFGIDMAVSGSIAEGDAACTVCFTKK